MAVVGMYEPRPCDDVVLDELQDLYLQVLDHGGRDADWEIRHRIRKGTKGFRLQNFVELNDGKSAWRTFFAGTADAVYGYLWGYLKALDDLRRSFEDPDVAAPLMVKTKIVDDDS